MAKDLDNATREAVRELPSVDELLRGEAAERLAPGFGRRQRTEMARAAIAAARAEILDGKHAGDGAKAADAHLAEIAKKASEAALRPVINATGVLIHTNLGRAPLSDAARDAVARASRYCSLEFDLDASARGRRAPLAETLLCELTGAEAALVVNNCAAAAFLVLKTFASSGSVIVSRGELVEIGGDFRIPDILAESGAAMREVGTTNRTRIEDVRGAIDDSTRVILRVHPSNFRILGFTEQPTLSELVALSRERGVILYEDLGSGALIDLGPYGMSEPVVSRSIDEGVDIVTFSGDKLLGGPQAGIIVGRRDLIAELRGHPLYRALRLGKLSAAALEATLLSYRRERAADEVPVLMMLAETSEDLGRRTADLFKSVEDTLRNAGFVVNVVENVSAVGGGAAPGVEIKSCAIALRHATLTADRIEEKLRENAVPVIARIKDDSVLVDLRAVSREEEPVLVQALVSLVA